MSNPEHSEFSHSPETEDISGEFSGENGEVTSLSEDIAEAVGFEQSLGNQDAVVGLGEPEESADKSGKTLKGQGSVSEEKNDSREESKISESISQDQIGSTEKPGLPPKGWMTKTEAGKEFGTHLDRIERFLAPFREESPEWFKKFRHPRVGRQVEFIHPKGINLLKTELEIDISAPEGWMTNFGLSKKVGRSGSKIQAVIDSCRDEHPEWFRSYTVQNGNKCEHYHPELVGFVEKELIRELEIPEGWKSFAQLAEIFERGPKTVRKMVKEYREGHPEWFLKFKGPLGGKPTVVFETEPSAS